jgi:hypothetical protein
MLVSDYLTLPDRGDQGRYSSMAELKVFHDREGPTLTVSFADPSQEYVCEETGDEVVLMKDRSGRVIGFEKLNFSLPESDSIRVAIETAPVSKSRSEKLEKFLKLCARNTPSRPDTPVRSVRISEQNRRSRRPPTLRLRFSATGPGVRIPVPLPAFAHNSREGCRAEARSAKADVVSYGSPSQIPNDTRVRLLSIELTAGRPGRWPRLCRPGAASRAHIARLERLSG